MLNFNSFTVNKVLSKILQKGYLKLFSNRIYKSKLIDVATYLKLDINTLITRALVKNTENESLIWNKIKRKTINDYRDYYTENIHYVERQDLYNLNHLPILTEFKNLKLNANILDYGCGTAFLAYHAKLNRSDLNIYLADIPEAATKDFVLWRFNRKNIFFNWLDIPNDEDLDFNQNYDLIRCHDVFEHSFFPLKVINYFYNTLNNGGYLSFDYLKDLDFNKETTREAQEQREEVLKFVNLHFKIIYNYNNKYVVQKKK